MLGKSTFVASFIEELQTNYRPRTQICLISPTLDSTTKLRAICEKRGFSFCYFDKIPQLKNIEDNREDCHKCIIFEDMSHYFSSLNSESVGNLCSFLLKSRHLGISVINILHSFTFTNKLCFQRVFLQNASLFAIFSLQSNKFAAQTFLKHILSKKSLKLTDEIFSFCLTVDSQFPHLFINPHIHLDGDTYHLSQCRTDIFKSNFIFYRDN